MNRLILIVPALLLLLFCISTPAYAQSETPLPAVRVDREEIVRNGPGSEFDIAGRLAPGTVAQVIGCDAGCTWFEVAPAIWIAASQVTPMSATSQPNAAASLPIPTPVPTIEVGIAQNNTPSVTTQSPEIQLVSDNAPGILAVSAPVPPSSEVEPLVLQAPETPRAITTVIAPGTEVDGLKAKATSYDVRELTRNTENYVGHSVAYYGRVLQVLEDKALFSNQVTITLRFAVDDSYGSDLLAKLVYEDGEGFRPLEGDLLTIWGTVEGLKKYTDVRGLEEILPTVRILYLETESEQESTYKVFSADETMSSSSPTLKALSYSTQGSNDYLYIYGEVQNQSDYPVNSVIVEVTLRDADGNLVATDHRYSLLGTIPANGKSPYSIGFNSWQNAASYNLSVEGNRGEPGRQDLVIHSRDSIVEGSNLRIVGEVANTGTTPAQSVKVIITLYDNTGRVVGSDYAYKTLGAIPPGAMVGFTTSTPLPDGYSYYEMQVEGQ